MSRKISLAVEDHEIENCYAVMSELRPHVTPGEFLPRVRRQMEVAGYGLAYLSDGGVSLSDGDVRAVAGFRVSECLAWGKFMYVDDLVSKDGERSKGYGGELFDWLVGHARSEGCDQFHLDSGVHRFAAHRFYLNKRMFIEAHHFGLKLKG